MGRRSSITKLPKEQQLFIEGLIREGRHTLDEMLAAIRRKFPEDKTSRSSLHRYSSSFDEMIGRMREIDHAAQVLVTELGENVDEKAGALLAQAVTTLATDVALRRQGDDKISTKEVAELARAARSAAQARMVTRKEREAIREAARQRVIQEQAEQLKQLSKEGGISAETEAMLKRRLLGIG